MHIAVCLRVMQVALVEVIDVTVMLDGRVAAILAMHMIVVLVNIAGLVHCTFLSFSRTETQN